MTKPTTTHRPASTKSMLTSAALAAAMLGASFAASAVIPTGGPTSLAATIKARQHYFGLENVNATTGDVRSDRVIMSWLTTTTFAVAANGKVFFLDSYLYQDQLVAPPALKRLPTTLQEMVDANPAWVFLGHGHFDHSNYAANIAYRTGATIFGAAEHCAAMQVDAAKQFGAGKTVNCTSVLAAGVPIGTQRLNLPDLKPALCLNVIRHIHGAEAPPDPALPKDSIAFTDGQDPRQPGLWGTGPELWPDVSSSANPDPAGSLVVLYHFTVPGPRAFSFAAFDSVGALKEQAPNVIPLLRAFPATDVLLGAVSGNDNPNNGLRDPAVYVQQMQPKVFVPTHHDQSQLRRGALGNAGEYWRRALLYSMSNIGMKPAEIPEIRYLSDPQDYLRPSRLTFDPSSARWAKTAARPNAVCN